MKDFKTLKQLNNEFKGHLVEIGKVQNKIDKLYNHLKKELAAFEQTLKEVKEDKSKFTKNGRKKVETIEEEETTRVVEVAEEINLNDFKNQIEKMKKLSYNNVKSLEVEEEIFGFDR